MFIFIALLFLCNNATISAMSDEAAALFGGMTAGAIEPFVGGQPLTTWKNYRQLGKPLAGMSPVEFWRGAPVASLCLGVNTGIQAGLNALFIPILNNALGSSLAAGAASAYIVAGPAELIIAQQQIKKTAAIATMVSVYQNAGLRALWRGCNWVAGREALFTAGYICFAPHCAAYFKKRGMAELPASILGGICGGIVAMIASHPFDTIKTRLAADVPDNRMQGYTYRTGLQVIRSQPLGTLFNGCVPRVLNGTFAITWFALFAPFMQSKVTAYKG